MHFVARCDRYPQFAFGVPALRPLLDAKGEKMTSCVVRFRDRVLDTLADGYTEEEAAAIKKALLTMRGFPPTIGEDITVVEVKRNEARDGQDRKR